MYSRNSFGNYYPIDSTIHKFSPIIKFINFFLCIILMIASTSLYLHLFMASLVLVMILLSFVPLRFYINSLFSLRYLLLILIFVLASLGFSLEMCLVYLLKIVIIVEYLNVIIYTTSPSEMNYGIEKILTPFNIFNLNMAVVSTKITSLISFVPLLTTTEYKILKTQASRGIDYGHSDIIGRIYARLKIMSNTLSLSIRKSKEVKKESELRLFNIHKHRTNLRKNKIGFYDLIFLAFHILLIVGYVFDKGIL